MYEIQQSTTAYPLVFLLVDSADHITGKTGLSPTVTLRKVGGAFGAAAGAVTEIANGWYQVAGNATDSNTLGPLLLHATGTGADPTDVCYSVVAFNPQDSVRLGLTALPNATAGANTGLPVVGTQIPNATAGAAGGVFIAGSNAATTVAGLTTGALSCTTITASGAVAFQSTFAVTTSTSLAALSCTTLTASGAVAFQSTFAVTTSTSLAALSCTTLTASGAVAFQSTFAVTTSTSLAALSCTTLTASGAVSFQSTFATTGTATFNAFTVTNAMTVTGQLVISDGVAVSCSTTDRTALVMTGNGTGAGAVISSGSGANANGMTIRSVATAGRGLILTGAGVREGLLVNAGATGAGVTIIGGTTSGNGITITTTSGTGLSTASLEVTGTTTFTGAVTGTNAANDLRINGVVPGAAGGLFIAGTNAATTITTSLTTTFTGNLTGSVGSVVGAVGSVTGAVGSVTGNVGGNVTGSVGSVVGAVGSVTGNVGGNVTGSVGSVVGDIGGLAAGAITDVEDAVWDAVLANHLDAGSTGFALNAAGSAGDPWSTALPGAYSAGTAGFIVGTNLNATITSRMATYVQPTGFLAATFPSGTIANNTTSPSWYTAPTTPPTTVAIASAVWQDTTAGDFTVANSIGKSLYTGVAPGTADGLVRAGLNASTTFNDFEVLGDLIISGSFDASNAGNNIVLGATERTAIATAWGVSVVGNSRTRDYFLQGGTNKIAFDVPSAGSYRIYQTDDTTSLKDGTFTSSAVSPVTALDPA